jgi:hypothetical protein
VIKLFTAKKTIGFIVFLGKRRTAFIRKNLVLGFAKKEINRREFFI